VKYLHPVERTVLNVSLVFYMNLILPCLVLAMKITVVSSIITKITEHKNEKHTSTYTAVLCVVLTALGSSSYADRQVSEVVVLVLAAPPGGVWVRVRLGNCCEA
jgi:hypothetical protein